MVYSESLRGQQQVIEGSAIEQVTVKNQSMYLSGVPDVLKRIAVQKQQVRGFPDCDRSLGFAFP
jgi:hypothetical protein